MLPAGRYVVIEGIEVSPTSVLEVGSGFVFVHGRACPMEDGSPGALICIMVATNARVAVHRNGRAKIVKEGE